MENFYVVENELESRVLGDIEFQSEHLDNNTVNFDFSIEETRNRYFKFLNLAQELSHEQPVNAEEDPLQQRRKSIENSPEVINQKNIENNLEHELKQLEGTSIESAFQDYNYWKPDVDHNVDQLLLEMNK